MVRCEHRRSAAPCPDVAMALSRAGTWSPMGNSHLQQSPLPLRSLIRCGDGEWDSCCRHRDTGEVLPRGAGGSWEGARHRAALGMQLHCSWEWAAWEMGAFQAAQHPGSAPAASRCARCDGLASAMGAQKGLPHRWPSATPQNCLLTALATSQKAPTTLQRGSASAISRG